MIRPFTQEDLPEVVDLWNRTHCADKVTAERLQSHLLKDENFDEQLFLLDREAGVLRGFAVGLVRRKPYYDRGLEQGIGWVYAFGVLPEFQRKGVASDLLHQLESRLKAWGAEKLVFGMYSPGYLMPGLDVEQYPKAAALLQGRGYRLGEEHISMYRTLFCYEVPQELQNKKELALQQGYRFTRCTPDKAEELLSFIKNWFTAGWLHNTKQLLQEGAPEDKIWLCIDPQGQIAGFAERGMGGIESRFGPFGIRPDCRSLSLGSILLSFVLYDMACRGIYLAYFMTTDERGAQMYARNGFTAYRRFRECILDNLGEQSR